MVKILTVGDPHVKRSNIPEIRELFERVEKLATEQSVDAIVILGDMANDHSKMYLQAWMQIVESITKLSEKFPVYYIVGNHDMLNNSVFLTNEHFFDVFSKLKSSYNINVVDKPALFDINDKKFFGIPYVAPGRFAEAFEQLPKDNYSIGFCHQEFNGSKMGAVESKSPDVWTKDMPLLVSGHIHDYQELFGGKVIYTGTCYQTGFGDSGNKTISIFTVDDTVKQERFDLGMRKKQTVSLSVSELLAFEKKDRTDYRFNVVDGSEAIYKFKKSKEYISLKQDSVIVFKAVDKSFIKKGERSSKGYVDVLSESIKDNKGLVEAFDKVMADYRGNE